MLSVRTAYGDWSTLPPLRTGAVRWSKANRYPSPFLNNGLASILGLAPPIMIYLSPVDVIMGCWKLGIDAYEKTLPVSGLWPSRCGETF